MTYPIIQSNFGFNIFRGFRSKGGQNFRFPIDFAGHRYNSAATAQPVIGLGIAYNFSTNLNAYFRALSGPFEYLLPYCNMSMSRPPVRTSLTFQADCGSKVRSSAEEGTEYDKFNHCPISLASTRLRVLSLAHGKNLARSRSSRFSLATARSRSRCQVYDRVSQLTD